MTTQTPDAVREAANVAAFHAIYGNGADPFTRPEAFGYASEVAGAILSALDSRAGDAGEEIENGCTADDAVDFVFNRLASKLGLAEWQVVEGSEEWEGDVSATLHRLLVDAGIIDAETGAVATLATPAPAVDAVPAGEVGEGIKLASDWLRANINNPMIPHWCDAMLDSLGVTNGVADLLAALSHGEGRK
ncbi:hypothetical protein [uncultured Novosphingobium sp.]|uniref:hypothetical protein n=1 Tax=uncultured Novosphingobium sp. TaxID=292277 RepID=UPI003748D678